MGAWLDRLALFWLDATVASAALLIIVTLMMVACHQPSRRSTLARGAIVGVLLMPALIWASPAPKIEAIRHLGRFGPPPSPPMDLDEAAPRPKVRPIGRYLPRALLVVYGLGVLAGLSRLAIGYWGLGRVVKGSSAPSEATLALLDALTRGRRKRPGFRVSERLTQPAVIGIFRPTILIPPALDRPESAEALRLCLLHELTHADRLDLGFGLLAEIARDLWFPLPPIWWLRAQMRLDQEFLADGGAAFGYGSTGKYASSLVALADPGSGHGPAKPGPATPFQGAVSALFLRILMLVRCPFPMEPTPPIWWRTSIILLLSAVAVAASSITLRPLAPDLPEPPPSPYTFAVPSLIIDPGPAASSAHCAPHNLPLRLPRRFELSVELLSNSAGLGRIKVAGLSVAAPCDDCQDREAWHLVRIRRERDRIEVRLDDVPPKLVRHEGPPPPWLSITAPPGIRLPVRNLTVHW